MNFDVGRDQVCHEKYGRLDTRLFRQRHDLLRLEVLMVFLSPNDELLPPSLFIMSSLSFAVMNYEDGDQNFRFNSYIIGAGVL